MDAVGALRQIFLFKDVPEPALKVVAQAMEEVSVGAGETLASESDTPKALYLIRNGTVRATREKGKLSVVFGSGQAIGAVAFLDGGPAGMNVVALERVDLFALRPEKLAEKLAGSPEAAHQFYRVVARSLAARLRNAVDAFALAKERGGA